MPSMQRPPGRTLLSSHATRVIGVVDLQQMTTPNNPIVWAASRSWHIDGNHLQDDFHERFSRLACCIFCCCLGIRKPLPRQAVPRMHYRSVKMAPRLITRCTGAMRDAAGTSRDESISVSMLQCAYVAIAISLRCGGVHGANSR